LFGIAPTDPATFAGAVLVVAIAGLAGCVVPMWHATRVDPVIALRSD
jgi:ABC-type antimicrobial peptide transport system permease subunit